MNQESMLPTQPESIGRVLDGGFRLYRRCFTYPALLLLAVGILMGIPQYIYLGPESFLNPDASFWISYGLVVFVIYIVYVLVYGAIIHYCDTCARGENGSLKASLGVAGSRSLILLVAGFLYVVAVWLGMILLLIPGIFLSISLLLYANRIMLDRAGIWSSLRDSHRMVWGNWWRTMVVFAVVMIVYMVLSLAIGLPAGFLDQMLFESAFGYGPLSRLGGAIAGAVVFPYVCASVVMLDHDLKLRREGSDLVGRMQELDGTS